MGAGLLAVKSGFILFIKSYQFPLQINTLERERERVSRRVPEKRRSGPGLRAGVPSGLGPNPWVYVC
jgi:hypothetical protein